jgi:hypothetical protein
VRKQTDQMGKMTDGLMAQASLLPGKPANNYMVAVLFEGERQVNVVPLSGCEDGCTAAIKLAIEYLHSFEHSGMATDALVCGVKFWNRPPKEFIREMQGERPILVTNARDGLGGALGRRVLEPIRGTVKRQTAHHRPLGGLYGRFGQGGGR